jgi:hypothetical protein
MTPHLTNYEFIERAKKMHGDKYDYSKTVYVNNLTKLEIICKIHGSFWQTPQTHLRGNISNGKGCGCKECGKSNNTTLSEDEFIKRSKTIHGKVYDYCDVDYINNYTKVIITCKKHGRFLQPPEKHMRGIGCPSCNGSKGEFRIKQFLDHKKIVYESQKKFNDLKSSIGGVLRYDFFLPIENILIEYNGEQHYNKKSLSGITGQTGKTLNELFSHNKKNDRKKITYAKNKNIKLIIIKKRNLNSISKILEESINEKN